MAGSFKAALPPARRVDRLAGQVGGSQAYPATLNQPPTRARFPCATARGSAGWNLGHAARVSVQAEWELGGQVERLTVLWPLPSRARSLPVLCCMVASGMADSFAAARAAALHVARAE